MHTRFATQGAPEVNDNNHPIPHGSLVGVHNGVIYNDWSLWMSMVDEKRRYADVDSEVIFAALAHGVEDSGSDTLDVLSAIRGPAAVAWLDQRSPNALYLARANQNPIIIGQTEGGSLIFASEESAVVEAAAAAGLTLTHIRDTQEGSFLTVEDGRIADVRSFVPATSYSSSYGSYAGSTSKKVTRITQPRGWRGMDELDDPWTMDDHTHAYEYGYVWDYQLQEWVKENEQPSDDRMKQAVETFMDAEQEALPLDGPSAEPETHFTSLLFDFAHDVTVRGEEFSDPYYTLYNEREVAIDDWFTNFRAGNNESWERMCHILHTFLRPGDPVAVSIGGVEYAGEVVHLPQTFPGGEYLLRVAVPLDRARSDGRKYEVVMVRRDFNGFRSVGHEEHATLLLPETDAAALSALDR